MDGLWGIVLAAGNGRRVESFTERMWGARCPKQFFAFTGRRSMLQHTLDRVEKLIPPKRILTVVSSDHTGYVKTQLQSRPVGTVIFQPQNRETLPGVLLPLVYMLRQNTVGTVAVFPSDHFIWEENRFMKSVQRAAKMVDMFPDRLVLLGVKPDFPETDYGWIEPGEAVLRREKYSILRVRSFYEKPGPVLGRGFMGNGCLWNTLVFVAKAMTLYNMARRLVPEMVSSFDELYREIGTSREEATLQRIYARMEPMNISKGLFERDPTQLSVLPLEDVGWSDWGRADRILKTIQRYGKALNYNGKQPSERTYDDLGLWPIASEAGGRGEEIIRPPVTADEIQEID